MGIRGLAGRKIALTEEEKKKIITRIQDAYQSGASLTDASRMMGIDKRTYNTWAKSLGIISLSENRRRMARF